MKKIVIFCYFIVSSFYVNAGIITYSERTAFQNDTGVLTSFEGFNNTLESLTSVNATGGYEEFWTINSEGSHSQGLIELSAVEFTFAAPVYAFGFDVIELNNGPLDYSDSAGHILLDAISSSSTSSDPEFYGFISDTLISSFTLGSGSDSGGSVYFVDALETRSLVSAVPEPTSLALLGLGVAGIGFSRKKKKINLLF